MKNILSFLSSLAGLVFGAWSLILTVLCVFYWQPVTFIKCFLFYMIFSAVDDAILHHTRYYIYYHIPLISQRTFLQNRIVSGDAGFFEKVQGIIMYSFAMLFFDKLHIITALIVSTIIFVSALVCKDIVPVLGTVLIGVFLINNILPLYARICFASVEAKETKEIGSFFLVLGGKIQRKWFFLNHLIYLAFGVVFTLIILWLKNWVIVLILVPYILAFFVLGWGNVYKRINDIFDSHKKAITFTIIYALFCLVSPLIYKYLPDLKNPVTGVIDLISLLLLFLPSKKEKVPLWYKKSLKALESIKEKFSDAVFDEYFYNQLKEKIKSAKRNVDYAKYFESHTVREWLYAEINNIAGDMIESGEHHIYRGLLSPLGKRILWYYNKSLAKLVKLQAKDENGTLIDKDYAANQYKTMLGIIKDLG